MNLPPDNILFATLKTLHMCSYTTRNWTLQDEVSRKQINDLWEAVHEIPCLLTRWRDNAEEELLMYLDEYTYKWSSPNLRIYYEQHRDELFLTDQFGKFQNKE